MVELVTMNSILVLLFLAYESLICLVALSLLCFFLTPVRIVAGSGIDGVGGIVGWSGTLRGGAGIYC